MIHHASFNPAEIRNKIRKHEIQLGGHAPNKIYGTLQCTSGKRMKIHNRVFFESVKEAEINGYRPCGNCMPMEYLVWKKRNKRVE
ncbi:MAG: metal-binding protein [Cyclobacteriaceae bacterium]|nr:metal-binding protein [Cyclobacteriaceae bacterium]